MTELEFAQSYKQHYPEYNDIPDSVLTRAVLEKHPEYRAQVETEAITPTASAPMTRSQLGRQYKKSFPRIS